MRLPAVFEHLAPLAMAAAAVIVALSFKFFDRPWPSLWAG
jgi:hypothetical protein